MKVHGDHAMWLYHTKTVYKTASKLRKGKEGQRMIKGGGERVSGCGFDWIWMDLDVLACFDFMGGLTTSPPKNSFNFHWHLSPQVKCLTQPSPGRGGCKLDNIIISTDWPPPQNHLASWMKWFWGAITNNNLGVPAPMKSIHEWFQGPCTIFWEVVHDIQSHFLEMILKVQNSCWNDFRVGVSDCWNDSRVWSVYVGKMSSRGG